MELIKRQKWENLFKRRELVHTDAVKEFYAKMSVIHLKKKDIVKSKVRGVEIEFDHEKLATILGIPGNNGICEYVKDVWEESKYIKPLEITRRFANNETLTTKKKSSIHRDETISEICALYCDEKYSSKIWEKRYNKLHGFNLHGSSAFGVPLVIKKGEEPKKYDFFEDTFLTMCKLTRENGIWWIGSGENRRRDNDEDAPEVEAEDEDEGNKDDFDWEAVIDEATVEGESGSDDQFYDAQVEVEEPVTETPAAPASSDFIFTRQKDQEPSGVDPSGPTSREADFLKFQAEFERKRANRFHDELEKAKTENAKLLALLHQAQTKPHP
ncbi:hypothetical protein Dimus_003811 [Dionaea muscipula]